MRCESKCGWQLGGGRRRAAAAHRALACVHKWGGVYGAISAQKTMVTWQENCDVSVTSPCSEKSLVIREHIRCERAANVHLWCVRRSRNYYCSESAMGALARPCASNYVESTDVNILIFCTAIVVGRQPSFTPPFFLPVISLQTVNARTDSIPEVSSRHAIRYCHPRHHRGSCPFCKCPKLPLRLHFKYLQRLYQYQRLLVLELHLPHQRLLHPVFRLCLPQ